MFQGLLDLSVWQLIAVTLVMTHATIVGVTVYLHRNQAHRAVVLHPLVSHFFRFWLWLTTGMGTRQWVAVHRCHHANVETEKDPHSPQVYGINKVLLDGTELYRIGSKDPEILARFGHGTPDDWLERNVYCRHSNKGYWLMMAINLLLFGPIGLTIWAVQMAWIPFFAAGVINGAGHYWGYRNFETTDASTNIVPVGILIGGEELHNNHHAFASSAKFSARWFEFDIGWLYIRAMSMLGLARVKKLAPIRTFVPGKSGVDLDTLTAIIANRLQVMSDYAKTVVAKVHAEEMSRASTETRGVLKRARALLVREECRLNDDARGYLQSALDSSQALAVVYQYKTKLQAIWQERTASQERLRHALEQWCREAEATGIRALQEFARTVPTYALRAT